MDTDIVRQKEKALASNPHILVAARFLTALTMLACTIAPSHAEMCEADTLNALKTRIHNYDHLKESRSLSTHYCTASQSDSRLGLSMIVDGIPANGTVNRQSMENACQGHDEQYLLDHHQVFEASYISDAALELCKGGLTFKAQRKSEESISVAIGFIPTETPEFAVFEAFEFSTDAVNCADLPQKGTLIFHKSMNFNCHITNVHKDIDLTLKTTKHGNRVLSIPRVPVSETVKPKWEFFVKGGNMGTKFQCTNEFGTVGGDIPCEVSNNPCEKDPDGTKRKLYCGAAYYREYKVIDGNTAVINDTQHGRSVRELPTR